jgi:alanine racemase
MSEILIYSEKLLKNFESLQDINSNVEVGIVVKSNGYSHDTSNIIKILKEHSNYFFVNNINEAVNLNSDFDLFNLNKEVHVMYTFLEEDLEILEIFPNIIFNICDLNALQIACNFAKKYNEKLNFIYSKSKIELNINYKRIKFNLNIDTGMGTLGIQPEELMQVISILKDYENFVEIHCVNTHFASADELNNNYYYAQIETFKKCLDLLNDFAINFNLISYHNSASLIRNEFTLTEYNKPIVARVGIALYGYYPSDDIKNKFLDSVPLTPIMKWIGKVISIKELDTGKKVGYGSTFTTLNKTTLAIVNVGYADGYSRLNSNISHVYINDFIYPVVGRIRMNLFHVDITSASKHSPIKVNDNVELINELITADVIAKQNKTINYEVLTRINP